MKTKILLLITLILGSLMMNAQTIMNVHTKYGTVYSLPLNEIDTITYTKTLAMISTLPISNITDTSATSGGNIISDGGTPVTQRGIVWSTSHYPTIYNNKTTDSSGSGNYISNLTGLIDNTTYYVRAYAINSVGTAYGNEVSFKTNSIVTNPGLGVTFDGYTYTSIVLGNGQEWMAENLRTTIYANGDPIPNITDNTQWSNLTTGAWSYYNNDSQYENPYGKLYNWYTVSDSRNVCPTGWHVPSNADWMVLSNYLGGGSVAGGKMKSTGKQYWQSPNTYATNQSGFSGLPGGYRYYFGSFIDVGTYGYWWSSNVINSISASSRHLSYSYGDLDFISFGNKTDGFSIRCLKD